MSTIRRVQISADLPISIEDNPNSGFDIDQFHFEDCYFTAAGTNPCVLIAAGVNLTNVTFDGYQAWAKGGHGLYFSSTSTVPGIGLSLQNVRWEQSTNPSGYAVYVNAAVDSLLLENLITGAPDSISHEGHHNGIYLRRCVGVRIVDGMYDGTLTALDISSCESVQRINHYTSIASTFNLGDMEESVGLGLVGGGAFQPFTAFYDKVTNERKGLRLYGSYVWSKLGTISHGQRQHLDGLTIYRVAGILQVAAHGATDDEGGTWMVGPTAAKYIAGTGGTSATANAVGKLSVGYDPTDGGIHIYNNLGTSGTSVDYHAFVAWRR